MLDVADDEESDGDCLSISAAPKSRGTNGLVGLLEGVSCTREASVANTSTECSRGSGGLLDTKSALMLRDKGVTMEKNQVNEKREGTKEVIGKK